MIIQISLRKGKQGFIHPIFLKEKSYIDVDHWCKSTMIHRTIIFTNKLASNIAIVITKIANIMQLNTGNGSKRLPYVSIKVSLYPISPIIITVVVIRDIPTLGNVF